MLSKKIKILLYGANLWYFGEGLLGPFLAIFTEQIGGDLLDISWAWSSFLIVTGVSYILVGRIVDGKEMKAKVMVLGYCLNALFTFLYLAVQSPMQLFFLQAGLGIATALATPTYNALYAKYEDRRHDTYEWGLAGGEAQIITGIAILVGGLIVTQTSFQTLFLVMGSVQVVAAIVQSRILFVKQ